MKYSVVFYLDFLIEQTYDQQKNGAPREHVPNAECKPCTKSSQSIAFPHPKLTQSYARVSKGKSDRETTEKQLKTAKIVLKRLV